MKRLLENLPFAIAMCAAALCLSMLSVSNSGVSAQAFKNVDFGEKAPRAVTVSPLLRNAAQRPFFSSVPLRNDATPWLYLPENGLRIFFSAVATLAAWSYFHLQRRRSANQDPSNFQFRYIHTR